MSYFSCSNKQEIQFQTISKNTLVLREVFESLLEHFFPSRVLSTDLTKLFYEFKGLNCLLFSQHVVLCKAELLLKLCWRRITPAKSQKGLQFQ